MFCAPHRVFGRIGRLGGSAKDQAEHLSAMVWISSRRPRYGAVGKHGSIAVIGRLILTLKQSLASMPLLPLRRERFRGEMAAIIDWYNAARPHTPLKGATPDEIYFRRFPACRRPRLEPRSHWPRGSPCAKPHALVRGKPGASWKCR